jgi:thiol-disulfide isomerase/thioredoxin
MPPRLGLVSVAEVPMRHHRQRHLGSRWILRAILAACLGALASCATSGNGASARGGKEGGGPVSVGEHVPAFVVHRMKGGSTIDLGTLKGKVVLLDIWASWCGPCKEEMPLLDDMAGRLKDKGIEFIAVSIDEEKAMAEAFLAARPQWTLMVAHDPQGKLPELLQPPKMPTSYLIDAQGIVRYINAGFERADAKKIEDRLLQLAAEGP